VNAERAAEGAPRGRCRPDRAVPWYREYFTERYWRFAERLEYSGERTEREVSYLLGLLEKAPGRRVADLGCGLGRHAVPLAEAGFEVTGIDVSAWAIEEAKRRSARAGVQVRWEVCDLLTEERWPLGEVDAAVCVQAFGWGSDAHQLRFLRKARRHLVPEGLLVLDVTNPLWIARNYAPRATVVDDGEGTVYEFDRDYDTLAGRSVGSLAVSASGSETAVLPHDIRLYTAPEVVSMVREAGYAVERIHSDFRIGPPITMDARYVQVVARPTPLPPSSLAVKAYETAEPGVVLDLRWSPDEVEWVHPSPSELWASLFREEPRYAAETARRYAVEDPYGAERAAGALSAYFACDVSPGQVTFGSGATSLLREMVGIADKGTVLSSQLSYPDLAAWAASGGSEVLPLDEGAPLDQLLAVIAGLPPRLYPGLIHLERPTVAGELMPLEDLEVLAEAAAGVGSMVLVDEASLSYFAGKGSAVPLVHRLDNLIVLRSLSKAYSWGGLRAGFAIVSEAIAPKIRELVAPLQVSETSYRLALRLLALGDIFGGLRARAREVKPEAIVLLTGLGLKVVEGHPELPWILIHDSQGTALGQLASSGVVGKPLASFSAFYGREGSLVKLAVPLSEERVALCRELLAARPTAGTIPLRNGTRPAGDGR